MIPARWAVAAPADPRLTAVLASDLHIPETPRRDSRASVGSPRPSAPRRFFRPDLERLSDPHGWAGMSRAVELIVAAVRGAVPILVHGDYDVDGQCAAALLTRVLASVGGRAHAFVPHRLRDGYDFGPAGLAEARRLGAGLIITCDCGITAVDAVRTARAAGIEVIVTDHHLPGDELPPCLRGARPAARRLSIGGKGSVRQRRGLQAGAGAGAGAGRVSPSAAALPRPRGASRPWPTWCR